MDNNNKEKQVPPEYMSIATFPVKGALSRPNKKSINVE